MTCSAGDGLVLVTRGLVTHSDVADPVVGQFVGQGQEEPVKILGPWGIPCCGVGFYI